MKGFAKMVLEMPYSQLERAVNPTHDIRLFSGRSNPQLAQEIADYLGMADSSYLRKQVLENLVSNGYLEKSKVGRANYYKANQELIMLS
jgi:hypothetical protein